ncbi:MULTISPECIES: hypothetical protein [Pseudomonas]|nr:MULTISPECIES: hypothetical protein [Pseudomonas]
MTWGSKALAEGIARQVVRAEKTYGTVDPKVTVENWNERFNFVKSDKVEQLVRAVELELPAVRNEKDVPKIDTVSYAVFKAAALTGMLDSEIEGPLNA